MVDAATNETPAVKSATDPRPADADAAKSAASQSRPVGKATAGATSRVAAATIDELLAKEALASLKRSRTMARGEPVGLKARTPIPAATLVVKKSQPQTWMTPFVTLAVIVAISSILSAGGIVYLFMRPVIITATSEAELRSLRDSVTQLRRTVTTLSTDVATTRTALDTQSKAASDRYGRLVQSVERVERDQSVSATKIERMAEEKVPVAQAAAPAASLPEITGTIQPKPPTVQREIIAGWRVRRAYEDIAILEGQRGVIEVVRGQEVPGLGRIDEIKYENGRWQVLTAKGVILSAR
jgi:hypothetical protein